MINNSTVDFHKTKCLRICESYAYFNANCGNTLFSKFANKIVLVELFS